jgi:hypothetical protein
VVRQRAWALIARAASTNRTVRGCVSAVLAPSLNSNSAAALEGLLRMVVAKPTDAAPSRFLRLIFIIVGLPGGLIVP